MCAVNSADGTVIAFDQLGAGPPLIMVVGAFNTRATTAPLAAALRHRPIDPATGAATAASGQVQVSVDAALAALDRRRWQMLVADDRPRPIAGTGVDAVIRAQRRP